MAGTASGGYQPARRSLRPQWCITRQANSSNASQKGVDGRLAYAALVTGVDVWGEDIVGGKLLFETGDADGNCEWTGRGPLPIGWTAQPTALIPLWLAKNDGAPFLGDPRRALAAIVARYAALGLTPVTATELELYLVDPSGSRPTAPLSPTTGRLLNSNSVLALNELNHLSASSTMSMLPAPHRTCRPMRRLPNRRAIQESIWCMLPTH